MLHIVKSDFPPSRMNALRHERDLHPGFAPTIGLRVECQPRINLALRRFLMLQQNLILHYYHKMLINN
jgi:hypothetical protein